MSHVGHSVRSTQRAGASVAADELREQYARRVAVRVDKACRLSEVTSCWSRTADGRLAEQVDCPDHVMRGRDSSSARGGGACSSVLVGALGQCLAADAAAGGKRRSKRH